MERFLEGRLASTEPPRYNVVMVLFTLEIVIAILLIAVILMQVQGTGLSGSFGGTNESFRSRRSIEKSLIYATIVLAVLFALISLLLVIPR